MDGAQRNPRVSCFKNLEVNHFVPLVIILPPGYTPRFHSHDVTTPFCISISRRCFTCFASSTSQEQLYLSTCLQDLVDAQGLVSDQIDSAFSREVMTLTHNPLTSPQRHLTQIIILTIESLILHCRHKSLSKSLRHISHERVPVPCWTWSPP